MQIIQTPTKHNVQNQENRPGIVQTKNYYKE